MRGTSCLMGEMELTQIRWGALIRVEDLRSEERHPWDAAAIVDFGVAILPDCRRDHVAARADPQLGLSKLGGGWEGVGEGGRGRTGWASFSITLVHSHPPTRLPPTVGIIAGTRHARTQREDEEARDGDGARERLDGAKKMSFAVTKDRNLGISHPCAHDAHIRGIAMWYIPDSVTNG